MPSPLFFWPGWRSLCCIFLLPSSWFFVIAFGPDGARVRPTPPVPFRDLLRSPVSSWNFVIPSSAIKKYTSARVRRRRRMRARQNYASYNVEPLLSEQIHKTLGRVSFTVSSLNHSESLSGRSCDVSDLESCKIRQNLGDLNHLSNFTNGHA